MTSMTTRLNPYLNLRGTARDALAFYQEALGGEVTIMTFAEGGMPHEPVDAQNVMHGSLVTDGGLAIFVSDVPSTMEPPTVGTSVNVSLSSDDTDLRPAWDVLSRDADILAPFELAPWGDRFGMLNDRFGVAWLVDQAGHL